MSDPSVLRLPKLQATAEAIRPYQGSTAKGMQMAGLARPWTVIGPPGVRLTVLDVKWANGERDVRTESVFCPLPVELGPARPLARLEHGLRMSVLLNGRTPFVELGISRIKADSMQMWSNVHKASDADFEAICGTDWNQLLRGLGAKSVGTRERVLGDSGRRKSYLAASWEGDSQTVPVAAYLMSRVIPLLDIWSPVHGAREPLENQRRVYVVRLRPGEGEADKVVYVGETERTPEERFATHMKGGRTAARVVTRRGVSLLPSLYEHVPPVGDPDRREAMMRSSAVERWLADELRGEGYTVHGAKRGLEEAPFVRGD